MSLGQGRADEVRPLYNHPEWRHPFSLPPCQVKSHFLYTSGEKLVALYFSNAYKWGGSHDVLNLLPYMAKNNLVTVLYPLRRPLPGSVLLHLVITRIPCACLVPR